MKVALQNFSNFQFNHKNDLKKPKNNNHGQIQVRRRAFFEPSVIHRQYTTIRLNKYAYILMSHATAAHMSFSLVCKLTDITMLVSKN